MTRSPDLRMAPSSSHLIPGDPTCIVLPDMY